MWKTFEADYYCIYILIGNSKAIMEKREYRE